MRAFFSCAVAAPIPKATVAATSAVMTLFMRLSPHVVGDRAGVDPLSRGTPFAQRAALVDEPGDRARHSIPKPRARAYSGGSSERGLAAWKPCSGGERPRPM